MADDGTRPCPRDSPTAAAAADDEVDPGAALHEPLRLSGRLDLQVGDDRRIVAPGTFIGIPTVVAHTMAVVGDEPVKMLMILSNPARALQMVDTLEEAFANGEPDPETIGPLLAQIDMEMLAPAAS